jgi:hypothetical protein
MSWSAQDIPGVTQEAFNAARQMGAEDIMQKNLEVGSWGDAFLLMVGASSHAADTSVLKGLIAQITNSSTVQLKGTKRLVIWETNRHQLAWSQEKGAFEIEQ